MLSYDHCKEVCRVVFNFSDEQLFGDKMDIKDTRWFGLTPKQIIDFVRNDLFTKNMHKFDHRFGTDIWLLCLGNKYEQKTVHNTDVKTKTNMPNIGVCGKMYNGKDTIADYLCSKYGYTKIAFADTLKEVCRIVFGLTYEQLYGKEKETRIERWYDLTPRLMFQFVGTELFRNNMSLLHEGFGRDIWLLSLKQKLGSKPYVISDIRFDNELTLVKEMKGISIKVIRPDLVQSSTHESETNIDKLMTNVILYNNGTIEQLYQGVDEVIKKIDNTNI